MITPENIWLIDMGDEVCWCDCPNPDEEHLDCIKYIRHDVAKNDYTRIFARIGGLTIANKKCRQRISDLERENGEHIKWQETMVLHIKDLERQLAESIAQEQCKQGQIDNLIKQANEDRRQLAESIAQEKCKQRQLAEAQAKLSAATNTFVELGALLEWIEKALNGEQVSDFAESYPLVRAVVDLQAKLDAAHDALTTLANGYLNIGDNAAQSIIRYGLGAATCPLKEDA